MRQTGVYSWLFQRISGVVLLFCLAVHFYLMHYMGFEMRLHADVLQRLRNPMWKSFYMIFLVLGLFHGLNGTWSIAVDYIKKDAWRITCLILVVTLGTFFFLLGAITILVQRMRVGSWVAIR